MERIKINQVVLDDSLFKLKADIIKKIKNDQEFMQQVIRKLGYSDELIDDYVGYFENAQKEFHNCQTCLRLNACKNDNHGMKLTIAKDGNYLRKSYEACQYYLIYLQRKAQFTIKDFADKYDDLTVDQLQDYDDEQRQKLIKRLKGVLGNYDHQWIYICGETKSDKTTFAIAFANSLIDYKHGSLAFIDMSHLLRQISDMVFKDKEKFNQLFAQLSEVKNLILDDFGSGYLNSVIRDSFIIPLLNHRSKNDLLTVFTSRYSIKDSCAIIAPAQTGNAINPINAQLYDLMRMNAKRFTLNHLKI